MRRRFFIAFAAMSLVGCILAIILAVRSFFAGDLLFWEIRDFTPTTLSRRIYTLELSAGGVCMGYAYEYFPHPSPALASAYRSAYAARTQSYRYHENVQYPHDYSVSGSILPNHFGFILNLRRMDNAGIPGTDDRVLRIRRLIFPIWLPILLAVLLPLRWSQLWRGPWRRQHRAAMGQCPTCSYDLRAHHPGDKCPECGSVII